jgi:hypothetical protein
MAADGADPSKYAELNGTAGAAALAAGAMAALLQRQPWASPAGVSSHCVPAPSGRCTEAHGAAAQQMAKYRWS